MDMENTEPRYISVGLEEDFDPYAYEFENFSIMLPEESIKWGAKIYIDIDFLKKQIELYDPLSSEIILDHIKDLIGADIERNK